MASSLCGLVLLGVGLLFFPRNDASTEVLHLGTTTDASGNCEKMMFSAQHPFRFLPSEHLPGAFVQPSLYARRLTQSSADSPHEAESQEEGVSFWSFVRAEGALSFFVESRRRLHFLDDTRGGLFLRHHALACSRKYHCGGSRKQFTAHY